MKYLGIIIKHTSYKNTNLRKCVNKTFSGFTFFDSRNKCRRYSANNRRGGNKITTKRKERKKKKEMKYTMNPLYQRPRFPCH